MAPLDGDGRVLPERPPAHMDRLVRGTPAALVPRRYRVLHPGAGAGHRVDAVSSPPLAHRLLSDCYSVGNWRDLYRELHLPQLPRSDPRISLVGRPLLPPLGKRKL